MEKEHLDILGNIDNTYDLEYLKEDAEKYIDAQLESENILTGKATNIFQILVAVFISIIGYFVSTIGTEQNDIIINCCMILGVFVFVSLIFMIPAIKPGTSFTNGVPPRNVLSSDILDGSETQILRFLKNRIYCLDNDIKENSNSQAKREFFYKISIYSLLTGLLVTFLYAIFV